MEFEKGIFRVYDRMLREPPNSTKKKVLTCSTWFFLVLTVLSTINLVAYHKAAVGKNGALKKAIESQYKEKFYQEYDQWQRFEAGEIEWTQWLAEKLASNGSSSSQGFGPDHYKDLPVLKLNYTAKSQFAFDNTTKKGIEHLIGDIFDTVWGKRHATPTGLSEAVDKPEEISNDSNKTDEKVI